MGIETLWGECKKGRTFGEDIQGYWEYPKLKKNRRPKAVPLTEEEKRIIDEIWGEKRFGSRLLYKELKKEVNESPIIRYTNTW